MALASGVDVPCPECGEKVHVGINATTEYIEARDGLQVMLVPDMTLMIEHYVAEHAGADLDP